MKDKELIIKEKDKFVDIVLGGKVIITDADGKEIQDHELRQRLDAANIETPETETVTVTNPITGKSAEVILSRRGTPDADLAIALLDKNSDQQKRDSALAAYLFERGRESASFIAEIMVYKGAHTKETRAFKSQVRYDFEELASLVSSSYRQLSNIIADGLRKKKDTKKILNDLSTEFGYMADRVDTKIANTTANRMKDAGYGIYIDKNGQPHSIFEQDVTKLMEKEIIEAKNKK